MNPDTIKVLAKNPPLKIYNIGKAAARVAELEALLGVQPSEPSYNIVKMNGRIDQLESQLPKRPAPPALAPAVTGRAIATPATTAKLAAGMLPPAELEKLTRQNARCVIAGISFGARLDLLKGQIRAHLGSEQEATISRVAHLSGDAESFLVKVLEDAERRNAVDHRQACERASAVRLDARRKATAAGTSLPWNVAELEALAQMICGDGFKSELASASADKKESLIMAEIHRLRLTVPGLSMSGLRVTKEMENSRHGMTPTAHAQAQEMVNDFCSSLAGTLPLERFDAGGARAARDFIRQSTGSDLA